LRHSLIPVYGAILLLSSSCAWYKSLERSLVDDDENKAQRAKTVPRAQYDQLLVKYEELSKKYEALKEGGAEKTSLLDDLQRSQGENFSQGSGGDTETVDVFSTAQAPAASAPSPAIPKDLESQLALYRRGLSLKTSNPGEATKIFQQLENQGAPSIKARAKYEVGELLLGKQQYDLALQVFEDIINRHAHSGVVIEALRSAVQCSERLGLNNKKEQYASMLSDVFETN
jgi:TolA-binding protein